MFVSKITRFYRQPDMTSSSVLPQNALHSHVLDGFWSSDYDFSIASRSNYLSGMHDFFEITRFFCKPDMTYWFIRQGSLYAILHDGFWKSDHYFLIAFHSNFLSGMYGFRDNEVLLQAGYDVIVIFPPRRALRYITWRNLKEQLWLPDSVPL